MNTKHAPGPWNVEMDGRTVTMAGQACVVSPGPDNAPVAEIRANARLIALAPELAQALRACLAVLDGHWIATSGAGIDEAEHTARHTARAVLAKLDEGREA